MGRRYIAMASEIVFGQGGTSTHWYRALEDSIRDDQQPIMPDDTEHADRTTWIPGPYRVGGDLGGYAEPYYFGFVLQRALGYWSASTIHAPSAVYTHSVLASESDIQYFCVEKGIDVVGSAIKYYGCKFDNFRLESRMGQPLMWTGTVRGMKSSYIAPVADATVEAGYDAVLQPWMHHEVVITHGADTLKAQTFRLNLRHRLADAYYTSRFSEEWDYEGRELSGELAIKFDEDMLEKFFGADNWKRPGAYVTGYAITATYTTAYTFAGQGSLTGILRIHLPEVRFSTEFIRQRRRETEVLELPFDALYSRTYNYAIRATIRTTHAKPL